MKPTFIPGVASCQRNRLEPRRSATRAGLIAAALLLACGLIQTARAQDYWAYVYQDFDVTAAGSSTNASRLAHNIARFDVALSRILPLADARVPTYFYQLDGVQEQQIIGSQGAAFRFSGYEVSVVSNAAADPENPYWGALFGYTGGLLVSGRARRSPHWYQVGVPQLFANTQFEADQLSTGGPSVAFLSTLQEHPLIPMQTLLRLQADDPQLRDPQFVRRFEAQSWYVAREIYVEGKLRPEFTRYLALIKDGKSEAEAFAASFKISYAELDKALAAAIRDPEHRYVLPIPPAADTPGLPRQLSAAEVQARLGSLSLQWQQHAQALRLGTEALRSEPQNETALRVVAQASFLEGDLAAAYASAGQLAALPALSAAGLTDCGEVFAELAQALWQKRGALGADPPALIQRARQAFEGALSLDPQYLRAWAGLASLYQSPQDAEAARSLIARAEPVMEKHSYSGALARALATMCAHTGQAECAFRFGEYWRDDASSQADLDQAVAFLARLKTTAHGAAAAP